MELRRRFRVRALIALATAAQLLAISFSVSTLLHSNPTDAAQQVPYKVNFQGRLTDNSGNVLADGLYNVKFRLWTLASGGSNVWQEDRVITGTDNRIQITNGLFNIQFGDLTALSPALFVTGSGSLFLEVELPTPGTASCATNGCAVFTEGAMTPRQPLASSPYAMNSDTLDGIDSTAFGQLSAIQSWTDTNTFSKSGGAALVLSGSAASGGSILQIGSSLSGGSGSGTLFGANTSTAGDLLNLQVSSALKLKVDNSGNITTAGDISYTSGANHNLSVAATGAGVAGNSLTVSGGASGTGAVNGGDLVLQAGASGGSGTSGSVKIKANGTDTVTAFQVQNASSAPAFTIDTTANKVVIGDATGTNTGTTLLVVDTATADPATGYNGAQYYNSTTGKFRCYQAGAWTDCITGTITATANSTASFVSGLQNVAGTATGVAVETLVFTSATAVSNVAGATGFIAPAAGSFRTCLTKNNAIITAGSVSLRWRVNGASVGAAACTMNTTNTRSSATALDTGTVTFAAGDTIGIAYDSSGLLPAATNDFTTFWSVEYNASSGNGLTLQFVYDNSSSPAAITLANSKDLVVTAADTAVDPNFIVNLQCTTCSAGAGRFAVQNAGTDAFVVNPNNAGINLNQTTTVAAGKNLALASGSGSFTQAFTNNVASSAHTIAIANTNTGAGVAIQGLDLTPTNTSTASSGTNTLNVVNFAAGGALGGTDTTNGINFASATGYTNFINTPNFNLNNQGDVTSAFTALNGTSTTNGAGTASTTLILTNATNFDIGNYVQVNDTNCGGAGVNPCYAKITNKVSNTLTITPALTWTTGKTVNEYHIPEIGGVDLTQNLSNRYGRGYFIAGVATGNGTTYYNEDSIDSSLTTFDLLTSNVATLNIGTAATSLTIGGSGTAVTIPGSLTVTGTLTALGPATGASGHLTRSGTTLSPTVGGDNLTTSGNISTTGSGTITSAGAISAPTLINTINNLIINSGALSGVTGITFTSGNLTTSNGTINAGSGSIATTGAIGGGAITGTSFSAGSGTISTTGTSSGGIINATTKFQANGTDGVGQACGVGAALTNATFTTGILTAAGSCTTFQAAGSYLVQAPAGTTNTITAASGAQALIIKGTNGTATHLIDIYDTAAVPALQAFFDQNGALTLSKSLSANGGITTSNGTINTGSGSITTTGAIGGGAITGTSLSSGGGNITAGAGTVSGAVINATTKFQANGADGVGSTCGAGSALTCATFTTGILTSTGACTTFQAAGSYATTTLNNLGVTSINAALLSSGNNTQSVGSAANVWQHMYTGDLDAGSVTTALTLGISNATSIQIGKVGVAVSMPGGLTTSNGTINTGSGSITTTGAISGGAITGTSLATSGNGTINSGSGTISTTGAVNSGTHTLSSNGAAAAPVLNFTGSPLGGIAAAATTSLVSFGPAIAGGNQAANGGTYLGLNLPAAGAGSAADFLNFQKNGTVEFKVDNAGNGTLGGGLTVGTGSVAAFSTAGLLQNAAVDSSVTYTNLQKVGTINTGTWQGTAVGVLYGGTGQTTYTDGQLLIGNTTGNTLTKATLTGTANRLSINNGGGSITLNVDTTQFPSAAGANTILRSTGANAASWVANTQTNVCSDCALTTLSNVGSTSIGADLLPSATNSRSLGAATNIWQNIFVGNIDAQSATNTALTVGTAATTTAITIGRSGLAVSVPGGVTSAGALTTSGNISTTGSGTITSAGSFFGPTLTATINGLIVNSGALSGVGNITGAGAVTLASTTSPLTLTSGSGTVILGSNTVQRAAAGLTLDVANGASASTLTVTNSGAGVASLSVEGGVGIGTGQVFSVGATNGSTVSACTSAQYLASAAATGGLITGGSCATNDLQTTYNNSSSPATIGLTDAKNFVINAPDTTTDPSIIFNLQCATCSALGGRFAVQDNGTDVFTVNPVGSIVVAPVAGQNVTFNLPGSSSTAFVATSAPTADQVTISNVGQGVATAGVSGLNITYVGGAGAIEASGARIDTTPGTTSGSTWNGLRIVNSTNAAAGVALNGIKIEGPGAGGAGTDTGLNIATGWDIGLNIQSGGIRMTAMAGDPAVPTAGTLAVYARDVSGRSMLKSQGSSGVSYALQPSLFQQNIWIAQPGSANNAAQWQSQGAPGTYTAVPTLTTAGTQASSFMANFATTGVANAGNGFMQSTSSYFRGNADNGNNGFFAMSRVSFPGTLANYTSATLGSRFWSGFTTQAAIATMGASDGPTGDFAGFRLSGSAGETTFRFLTRNNATTTNQNTAVTLAVGDTYDLYIYCKPYDSTNPTQNATIYWRIDDLSTGAAPVEGSQTVTLPTATTAMRYMTTLNTINAAAKSLRIQRMYVETDR